jgi:hypothetical protein
VILAVRINSDYSYLLRSRDDLGEGGLMLPPKKSLCRRYNPQHET